MSVFYFTQSGIEETTLDLFVQWYTSHYFIFAAVLIENEQNTSHLFTSFVSGKE